MLIMYMSYSILSSFDSDSFDSSNFLEDILVTRSERMDHNFSFLAIHVIIYLHKWKLHNPISFASLGTTLSFNIILIGMEIQRYYTYEIHRFKTNTMLIQKDSTKGLQSHSDTI